MEVPRRQSKTNAPNLFAEVEEKLAVVFAGKLEDGVNPSHGYERPAGGASWSIGSEHVSSSAIACSFP
jgi:hypothetical protein